MGNRKNCCSRKLELESLLKEKEEAIRSSDIQKAREVQDRQAEAEKKLARLQARYDKKCEAGQLQVTEETIADIVSG